MYVCTNLVTGAKSLWIMENAFQYILIRIMKSTNIHILDTYLPEEGGGSSGDAEVPLVL